MDARSLKERLQKAIDYYFNLGYAVFPVTIKYFNGKKKLVNEFKWGSQELTKEISHSLLNDDTNGLAMLTGKKYNLFVVDLDVKPDSNDTLAKLCEQYGIYFGSGPMVSSLSGGTHYYYSFPESLKGRSTRESIVKNLDIRGDGGLIFVPPTSLNGSKYEWKVPISKALPSVPPNLVKLINDNTIDPKERPKDNRFKNVPEASQFLKQIKLTYGDWIKVGMALSEMGEEGRKYWFIVSDNEFYEDTIEELNYKFDNFLKTTEAVTVASLFSIAYHHGFTIEKNTFDSVLEEQVDNIFFNRNEMLEALKRQYHHADEQKYSLGWSSMDEYVKLIKPQLTIITGMPYSGKTNFMDSIMVNLAKRYKWRFVVFSPESQPLNEHIESLSNKFSGMALRKGYRTWLPETDHEFVIDWISQHFFIMNTGVVNRNLNHILKIVESQKIENDIDAFVLDPWNELEHARPSYQSETEYIGYILGRIKAIALLLDIHVFIIAHPTKVFPDKDGGKRVVKPYDISGSANWFNKADNMLSVYRDFDTDSVEIHIQKIKRRRLGRLGSVPLRYVYDTGDYEDVENGYRESPF